MQAQTKKQLILGIIAGILCLLVLKKYLPAVHFPTKGRIAEHTQTLQGLQKDLQVLQKSQELWNKHLEELRKNSTGFWIPQNSAIPVEQEVTDAFRNLQRLAAVNISRLTSQMVRNGNSPYIQEIELGILITGCSTEEFVRLLKTVQESSQPFYWSHCEINPENPNAPNTLRINARLKAYVLTENATHLLKTGEFRSESADGNKQTGKRRTGKNKNKPLPMTGGGK